MKAPKTIYICSECGSEHPKWLGKCPDCGSWNSFTEEYSTEKKQNIAANNAAISVKPLTDVSFQTFPRSLCGMTEFDRVLGGGLVQGSLILLSGDPGIGKSTLLLQVLFGFAKNNMRVLYASGEESSTQIKLRADRLKVVHPNILLTNETDINIITSYIDSVKPHALVIDSIQTMHLPQFPSSPGTVTQIRECTNLLMQHAKKQNISTIIIGHVTKDGAIAGPRILEHLVDSVLYLEGDPASGYRILRSVKNRFGSTGEIGVFAMHNSGLVDVPNPSELFLAGHKQGIEGSAVAISMEGSRPLLVEVQALVNKNNLPNPRRYVTGLDANRFAILTAVLEKRAGLFLSGSDIYANIAGGLKLLEPSIDLALAAAIASSMREKPLEGKVAYFGEVGLSGEIRATSHALPRIQEAIKMGFTCIYIPHANYMVEKELITALVAKAPQEVLIYPVENVQEIVSYR